MSDAETGSIAEFKAEFRGKLYQAIAGALIAIIVAIAVAAWAVAKSLPDKIGLVPRGTVAAFDLADECPPGWSAYDKALGRFIVGAVSEEELGGISSDFSVDNAGEKLVARPFGSTGGSQSHRLSLAEMPRHNHGGSTGGSSAGQFVIHQSEPAAGRFSGDVPYTVADHTHTIAEQGEDQPHPNVPQYVALDFCIRN